MTVGLLALSALIRDGSAAAMGNIPTGMFQDSEVTAFNYVMRFLREHGAYPTREAMGEQGFSLPQANEPLSYYLERLVERRIYIDLVPLAPELIAQLQGKNMGQVRDLVRQMAGITRDHDMTSPVTRVQRVAAEVLADATSFEQFTRGASFGYDSLDNETLGLFAGDLGIFFGRPNVGKSYYLFRSLLASWRAMFRPLLVSPEMQVRQVTQRMMGMEAGINPRFIRQRQLGTWARERLAETVHGWHGLPDMDFLSGNKLKDIGDLEFYIQELGPTCVWFDSAYMAKVAKLRNNAAPNERISEVADQLKSMADRTNTPIFMTAGANKNQKGNKNSTDGLDNMAGSDQLARHAAVAILVTPGSNANENWLNVVKNREGRRGFKIVTNFDFQSGMNFDQNFTATQAAEVATNIVEDQVRAGQ